MRTDPRPDPVARQISAATGQAFVVEHEQPVAGGCIHRAVIVSGCGRRYFVKRNSAACAETFAAESRALVELAQVGALRVPRPVCAGEDGTSAWLVLEAIDIGAPGRAGWAELGRGLAALHRAGSDRFGWLCDNAIGTTPQINTRMDRWPDFWRTCRLEPQLRLAADGGRASPRLLRDGARLLDRIETLFACHAPAASLLHGDLWSGNCAFATDGRPFVFDPATYYGDRETDLAMTELFGGFHPVFHESYRDAWPLADGYAIRREAYNLYHVLNHLNLFGGGYGARAEAMLEQLLAAL